MLPPPRFSCCVVAEVRASDSFRCVSTSSAGALKAAAEQVKLAVEPAGMIFAEARAVRLPEILLESAPVMPCARSFKRPSSVLAAVVRRNTGAYTTDPGYMFAALKVSCAVLLHCVPLVDSSVLKTPAVKLELACSVSVQDASVAEAPMPSTSPPASSALTFLARTPAARRGSAELRRAAIARECVNCVG